MKNKLTNLNNHLFEQLERLNDGDLKDEALKTEIERAKAMANIGAQIVQSAKVTVDAMKLLGRGDVRREDMSNILGLDKQLNGTN